MNRYGFAPVSLLAWALVLASLPEVSVQAAAPPAYHQRCWTPVGPGAGTPERDICFPPSQLFLAKRRVPQMVDPSAMVTSSTGLRLTDIVVSYWGRRFLFVDFLFSDLVCTKPCPGESAAHPRLIDVMQAAGMRYSARSNGYALNVPPDLKGYWIATGFLPARNLSFRIAGLARVQMIRQIAHAVLALA